MHDHFVRHIEVNCEVCGYVILSCNFLCKLTMVTFILLTLHSMGGGGEPSDIQPNVTFAPATTLSRPTGGIVITGLPIMYTCTLYSDSVHNIMMLCINKQSYYVVMDIKMS